MEGSWDRVKSGEMSPHEIQSIVSLFSTLGVKSVKITGGEPTLREDIVDIVQRISPLVDEVSMVTNGFNLEHLARKLSDAGLKRVNISLNMFNPEEWIAPSDPQSQSIIRGIIKARESGLSPIKLNMVVLKDKNSHQIPAMIEFSKRLNLILQLIELHMPRSMTSERVFRELYFPLKGIEEDLHTRSEKVEYAPLHRRRRFYLKGGGCVEVVRPMFNPDFCAHCYRIRVTSDGMIRPCLMEDNGMVNILTPIRNHLPRKELVELIMSAVRKRKPYWQ